MENSILVTSLSELATFAKNLLEKIQKSGDGDQAKVIALSGDLGAGKTTLVQLLAKELKILDIVTSPTFTIMKRYETGEGQFIKELVHMDAYRIESALELRPLHLEPIFKSPGTLICIEWAEKISQVLPKNTLYLSINLLDNDVREITITGAQGTV